MDAARWERIQSLFHAAADRAADERRAFLEAECGDDRAVIAEVLAMLEEDERGLSLLDRGVALAAHQVLGTRPAPALPVGEFGAYRIRDVLGEGGMGVVYLAERADLGSVAAIKILRDASLSPLRRERFAAEQRTLAQLNHPSIARLYDAGTLSDGTPWFVMEYVEGMPITEYCRARTATMPERLRLFREVCEAAQHAHRHLVIHRDLKPSNILVGHDGTVKLLDFGIAKQLESLDVSVNETRTAMRFMTPAYAAPEQLRGDRVGVHTDVYSLGVVLYELLVGRLPFDLAGRSAAEAETIILEREVEKPSVAARRMPAVSSETSHIRATRPAVWSDLDVLCLTAMHKDPLRRYRTVEALIRDVDHFLDGEPLEARPDSVRYRAGKFIGRNRRPLTAAAIVVAGVVGLVAFYTIRLTEARNAAVAEAARTQRIQRFTMNLLAGGDVQVGPAESLRVVTLVDRGVQEARTLDPDPAVQAEMSQTLGEIYHRLGKFDRADSLLSAALETRRTRLGQEHPDVATSLIALGELRSSQAKFEEAEGTVRSALAIATRQRPGDHPEVLRATSALGDVLVERGKYDEAIGVFRTLVGAREAADAESAELAASLYQLASAHFYAGHHAASDSLNKRVLAIYRTLYGERHPHVADALVNLGAVQHEQGHYAEAETYHRQALEITRGWYGAEHYKTAANLTMVARALVFQDRYDEAATLLRQALAVRERVYGPVHPLVASTVNEMGSSALHLSRYADAEAAYRRMIDIYQTVYGGEHYLMGIALSNLASVYMAQRENARAESLFRQAIAVYERTQPPGHLNIGIARIKLGRVLLRQGRFVEAERATRAGYEIVSRQASPAVSFLRAAREDLIIAYDSLGRSAEAARFRSELAEAARSAKGG